jgi:type IV pilus assembly protein PilA
MRVSRVLLRKTGFTLVELMLVVTIIALLSALAIPRYANYQCKAKQTEARKALGSMAKMQEAYFAEYSVYSMDLSLIGFSMKEITGPGGHYDYEMVDASDREWKGRANGKQANFRNREDVWTIDQSLILTNVENACQ